MKRIFTLGLAAVLTLSLSATAFAFDIEVDPNPGGVDVTITVETEQHRDVDVKFQVDPTYTVTIPASVTLAPAADGRMEQEAVVGASDVKLGYGETLKITIGSDSDFNLSIEGSSQQLHYTVQKGSLSSEKTPLTDNTVAAFGTAPGEQTQSLYFVTDSVPAYAGNYKDTVVFTISVE